MIVQRTSLSDGVPQTVTWLRALADGLESGQVQLVEMLAGPTLKGPRRSESRVEVLYNGQVEVRS